MAKQTWKIGTDRGNIKQNGNINQMPHAVLQIGVFRMAGDFFVQT